MPIEFEEQNYDRPNKPIDQIGKRLPINNIPVVKKNPHPILAILIKLRIAKDEDHAQFILLILTIILFGLAIYYIVQSYQALNPTINTAPIDLNQIQ